MAWRPYSRCMKDEMSSNDRSCQCNACDRFTIRSATILAGAAHLGALGAPTYAAPSRERRSHNSLLRTTTNFEKNIATYVRIGVDRCTLCVELLVVSDSDVTSIRAGDARPQTVGTAFSFGKVHIPGDNRIRFVYRLRKYDVRCIFRAMPSLFACIQHVVSSNY